MSDESAQNAHRRIQALVVTCQANCEADGGLPSEGVMDLLTAACALLNTYAGGGKDATDIITPEIISNASEAAKMWFMGIEGNKSGVVH